MGARPFLLRVRAVTPWFLLHCVWKACSSREGVVHRYVRDAHAQTSGSEVVGSLRITGFFFFWSAKLACVLFGGTHTLIHSTRTDSELLFCGAIIGR